MFSSCIRSFGCEKLYYLVKLKCFYGCLPLIRKQSHVLIGKGHAFYLKIRFYIQQLLLRDTHTPGNGNTHGSTRTLLDKYVVRKLGICSLQEFQGRSALPLLQSLCGGSLYSLLLFSNWNVTAFGQCFLCGEPTSTLCQTLVTTAPLTKEYRNPEEYTSEQSWNNSS